MQAIPNPKNYFAGITSDVQIPKIINMFERTRFQHTHRSPQICHHRFNLITSIKGGGSISAGEHIHVLNPGESILIFPFQNQYFLSIEQDVHWVFAGFELDNYNRIEPLRNVVLPFNTLQLSELEKMVDSYLARPADLSVINQTALHLSLILERLLSLQQSEGQPPPLPAPDKVSVKDRDFIEKILKQVYASLHSPLCIVDIADNLKISQSYLSNRFKTVMGIPLGTFIRDTKISKAGGLLYSTNMTLGEIADQLGYSSPYTFSRTFKQVTGISPKTYRKQRISHM